MTIPSSHGATTRETLLRSSSGAKRAGIPIVLEIAFNPRSEVSDESNVPFSTLIEPSNPSSGPYGGMSVGIFPVEDAPCLIALGTGTTGLQPDEAILARPGHARKANAICEAINRRESRFAA